MSEYLLRVKRHFTFSATEQKEFLITALVFAFVLSFRKWGSTTFNAQEGALNFLLSFIIISAVLFVHISAQKLLALKLGYTATYSYWLNGLFIGIIVAFFSYGFIPVLLAGTVSIEHHERMRLGRFRYGLNYKDLGKVAFAGAFANILFILLLKPLVTLSASPSLISLGTDIIWFNVLVAVYSLLPFRNSDGLSIFFSSRNAYVFCVAFILIYSMLVLAVGLFSLIVSALLALFVSWIFLTIVDKPV